MPDTGRQRKRISSPFSRALFAGTAVLVGLGLAIYPFLADLLYEYRTEGVISALDEAADGQSGEEDIEAMLAQADEYNRKLREEYYLEPDLAVPEAKLPGGETEYQSLLSFDETGVMGYVSIPCIDVDLPVYHGAGDAELKKGAGHLFGTSLPVGGSGTHAVITAHTGVGKARFFTDLTELRKGDCFVITIPGRRLLYRTDRITVVSPEDTSPLEIEEGKDYCTLLTCTPYGINSHRLLVRGERVEETVSSDAETLEESRRSVFESEWVRRYLYSLLTACTVMTGAAAVITAIRRMRRT